MASAEIHDSVHSEFEFRRIDLPGDRDYDDPDDADLDARLVDAIKAARKADNENLASELELQLGSHYYGCELGL